MSLPQCRVNRGRIARETDRARSLGVPYTQFEMMTLRHGGHRAQMVLLFGWLSVPRTAAGRVRWWRGPYGCEGTPLCLSLSPSSMPSTPPSTLWSFSSPALAQGSTTLRYVFFSGFLSWIKQDCCSSNLKNIMYSKQVVLHVHIN